MCGAGVGRVSRERKKKISHRACGEIKLRGRPLPCLFEAFGSITSTVGKNSCNGTVSLHPPPYSQKNSRKRKRGRKGEVSTGLTNTKPPLAASA